MTEEEMKHREEWVEQSVRARTVRVWAGPVLGAVEINFNLYIATLQWVRRAASWGIPETSIFERAAKITVNDSLIRPWLRVLYDEEEGLMSGSKDSETMFWGLTFDAGSDDINVFAQLLGQNWGDIDEWGLESKT